MTLSRREFTVLAAAAATGSATGLLHGAAPPAPAPVIPTSSLPGYAGPWEALFNGRDLNGWSYYQTGIGNTDTTNAIAIKRGMIHMLGPHHSGGERPGFGHIATTREYSNYHLRLQCKYGERRFEPRLLAKRNSGILYHMFPETDRVWPNAVEFQLEESDVGDAILINTRCWPGFDLGGTPAWPQQTPAAPRPTFAVTEPRQPIEWQRVRKNGDFERQLDWNTIELIAIGDQAAHLVNGRIVNTLYEMVGQDTRDRNAFRPLTRGRIGLELEGAEIYFKDVAIRPLQTA